MSERHLIIVRPGRSQSPYATSDVYVVVCGPLCPDKPHLRLGGGEVVEVEHKFNTYHSAEEHIKACPCGVVEEFPDAPACGTFQAFDETTWKAERARNLREQRRYEMASHLFVRMVASQFAGGWPLTSLAPYSGLDRAALDKADEFLDEMAKAPAVPE